MSKTKHKDAPKMSVIISTYNNVPWLQKTLWSYCAQNTSEFELVIADDGSGPETEALLDQMKNECPVNIVHVWHEDNGFQKSAILNKAILACSADYILMSDGDCLARQDFVKTHLDRREEGYFLSGGYFKLPMDISKKISKEDIVEQRCFEKKWLRSQGLRRTFKTKKLTARGMQAKLLNTLTPTKATWNGHNASGWKKDIIAVNGFDERMQYGGQDRELGERMMNNGIKGKQIRYSAVCLHLDHKRGYKTKDSIDKNTAIRLETKKRHKTYTDYGIVKPK